MLIEWMSWIKQLYESCPSGYRWMAYRNYVNAGAGAIVSEIIGWVTRVNERTSHVHPLYAPPFSVTVSVREYPTIPVWLLMTQARREDDTT